MTTRLSPWWRWEQGTPRQLTDAEAYTGNLLLDHDPVSPNAEVPTIRHVAYTQWPGDVRVSTIFLALDHQYRPGGVPVLFETMIFWPGHELDGWQDRYATRSEALAGHMAAVELVTVARNDWKVEA